MSDELKHYGKKGMKWGVRKDDRGGSQSAGSRWTEDQKNKAKNVGKVAGSVAIIAAVGAGAYFAQGAFQAYGGDVVASLKARGSKVSANDAAKISEMTRKAAAGRRAAETVLNNRGATSLKMEPELRKFIADTPSRILSDQKGWSESLGRSLSSIQKEDASFITEYIRNLTPKALGA